MLVMARYEEMAVKAILSLVIASFVVLCGVAALGINLMSCNLAVLAGGIGLVAFIIWLFSVITR